MSEDSRPAPEAPATRIRDSLSAMSVAQIGLFVLALIYSTYVSRSVLLPIILALLVTLMMAPVHRMVSQRLRLPPFLAALMLMAGLVGVVGTGLYHLGAPASRYVSQFGEDEVRERLQRVFLPISGLRKEIRSVAERVDALNEREEEEETPAEGSDPETEEHAEEPTITELATPPPRLPAVLLPAPPPEEVKPADKPRSPPLQVQIREDPTGVVYESLGEFAYHFVITLILACFLLGFGEAMLDGIPKGGLAAALVQDIQRDVSRYLLSITAINAGLGVVVALAMFLLGMPNPMLWGVMAMMLNFIPYVGALIGMVILFAVAATTFNETVPLLAVPAIYLVLTFIEGNFVTPTLIGRRFTINPIVVFMWVVAWGALWGLPGMLIGLPMLMVFRIICAKLPSLHRVERVISVRESPVARRVSV